MHTRDFHALDWLLDAYLRLERFDDARRVMDELDTVEEAIRSGGEEWGQFPEIAETLRAYYSSVVAAVMPVPARLRRRAALSNERAAAAPGFATCERSWWSASWCHRSSRNECR